MKFGIFSVVDHYPSELPRSTAQFYDELLEQCQVAERLRFDSFWIAEHHFHEYGVIPRPAVWMAAAARVTSKIKLGTAVVNLPFDQPLRVAEDCAMVDLLSGGRLVLGVGSGYLKHEFEGFGLDPEEKRERFDESLEILQKAWTGERFSYSGKYYNVDNVALNVVPVQQPSPPVYVAVLRSEAAPFVARRKLPLMTIPYASCANVASSAEIASAYKNAYEQAGGSPKQAVVQFALHTYCAETSDLARSQAAEAVDRYVRTRLYAQQRSLDTLLENDLVAIGSPSDIERVIRKYEEAGLDEFLAIMNFGGLDHKQVLASMELLAKEVLPRFELAGHKR